jgi:ribosomal protein L5
MNTASLKQDYQERIVPILMKEFGYTTVMQCPKLQKIVLNQKKINKKWKNKIKKKNIRL